MNIMCMVKVCLSRFPLSHACHRIRKPGMNGAIDPVQLAVEACGRVVACKVHARKGVEVFEMLRKKHAVTGSERGSKADGFGDLRLPLATGARVAKWIGKMLDRQTGASLQELSVFVHLPMDTARRCLCEIAMGAGMRANGHEGMTRELLQLRPSQCFAVDQLAAFDVARADEGPPLRKQAEILVNRGFNRGEGALLALRIGTVEARRQAGQFDVRLTADQFRQAKPPGVHCASDHSGGHEHGEWSCKLLHDRQSAG